MAWTSLFVTALFILSVSGPWVVAGATEQAAGGEQPTELQQRIQQLRQEAESKPDDASAQRALGEALYLKGDEKAAIPPLKRAAALEPNNVRVLSTLGSALFDTGQLAEALPVLQRASELDPKSLAVLLDLGATLCAQGQLEQGLVPLRKAVELYPNDPRPQRSLGKAYIMLKRWSDALDLLMLTRSIDEWQPEVEEMLHYTARNGKGEFAAAVKANEKEARAHGRLACALFFEKTAQGKEALAHIDRALALDPTSAEFYASKILILMTMGKDAELLSTARACTRAVPAGWVCHRELASGLLTAGKAPEALEELLQADRLNPGVISVQSSLCFARAMLGDMDAARNACESALSLGSGGGGDHMNLARVYFTLGQYAPALRQARIAEKMGIPHAKDLATDIEKKLAGR